MPTAVISNPRLLAESIRQLVARALSPAEWAIAAKAQRSIDAGERHNAERLLLSWEKRVAGKSPNSKAFDQRLERLGLDRQAAIDYLLPCEFPAEAPLPDWAEFLSEVLTEQNVAAPIVSPEGLQAWTEEELEGYQLDLQATPTFPEFLHPFVSVALRRIQTALADRATPAIAAQVGRYTVLQLSKLAVRVVAYEVKQWRFKGKLAGETPEIRYQYFVKQVLGTATGLIDFLLRYPVLARLLAVAAAQIADSAIELLQRAHQDRLDLALTFQPDTGLGHVEALLLGLSDPHQGGRTVCILRFASGLKLVYKPRSFEIDDTFNRLIDWLNQRGLNPPLRSLRLLPRQGYGWSEFIATAECGSQAEVQRFYQRQGSHAALMYFLCGTDFHYENFVPEGEYPVPIDLEGVLMTGMHRMPDSWKSVPRYLHPPSFCSVLSTNLSSYWRAGDYNQILFAASGINGCGDRPWMQLTHRWQGIGTDGLKLKRESRPLSFTANLPQLEGQRIPVNEYLPAVVQGFTATYHLVMQQRRSLLASSSPLAAFSQVTTRLLLRDTSEYTSTLFSGLAPDSLASGAAFQVALEQLADTTSGYASSDLLLTMVDGECRCLWNLDIPVYWGSPDSTDIRSDQGQVYTAAAQPSFAQMQQRLTEASEEDLLWQSELLRVSLLMSIYQPHAPAKQPEPVKQPWLQVSGWTQLSIAPSLESITCPAALLSDEEITQTLMAGAIAIGNALADLAMHHAAGKSWLSLGKASSSSASVSLIHPDPWQAMGAAGTSLFFTNLAQQTQSDRYAALAKGGLQFTQTMLRHCAETQLWQQTSASGLHGIGMALYALTEAGRCLQDDRLLDQALDSALQWLPDKLDDENPDVLTGAAGSLLVLLHLHRFRPDNRLLDWATRLAQGIVRCQSDDSSAAGWWIPGCHRPLMGMGHGAAGIAYALLRLYALTGEDGLRASAERGLAYERENFCPPLQDWTDFRQPVGVTRVMTGWCAGAPGIGLARLGILGILADEREIQIDLERSIAATQRHLGKHHHHLCCGEAGRLVFLAIAAHRLERPELRTVALEAALKMLAFYNQVGRWQLMEFSERSIIPGLLDGVAGIGLTLLALLAPESTSQVWLLD